MKSTSRTQPPPTVTTPHRRHRRNKQRPTSAKKKRIRGIAIRGITEQDSLESVASAFGHVRTSPISSFEKDLILDRLKKEIIVKFGWNLSCRRRSRRPHRQCNGDDDDNTITNDDGMDAGCETTTTKKEPTTTTADDDAINNRIQQSSSSPIKEENINNPPKQPQINEKILNICKSRVILGTNSCTRALELSSKRTTQPTKQRPLLIMMACDVHPPTILSHIPPLARRVGGVRVMLLPGGKASLELGMALGVKSVSVVLFLSSEVMGATTTTTTRMTTEDDGKETLNGNDDDDDGEGRRCHGGIDSFIDYAISKLPPSLSDASDKMRE